MDLIDTSLFAQIEVTQQLDGANDVRNDMSAEDDILVDQGRQQGRAIGRCREAMSETAITRHHVFSGIRSTLKGQSRMLAVSDWALRLVLGRKNTHRLSSSRQP